MDEQREKISADEFAERVIRKANDGYHRRDDYPPYAMAAWDDRIRWSDYLKKIIAAEFQALGSDQ